MSSQLPDTPNSMVSSPIEAWEVGHSMWTDGLNLKHTQPRSPTTPPPAPHVFIPSLPTAPKTTPTPGCILTLWRQSWDFFIYRSHPFQWPHRRMRHHGRCGPFTRLVTFAKTRRRERDSTIKRDLWVGDCPVPAKRCALLWVENWWFFKKLIHAPHHIIYHSGGEPHYVSSFNYTNFLHDPKY